MARTGREVHLTSRPSGTPSGDEFTVVQVEIDGPGEDELLVRNTWMSLDPAMRVRMGGSGGSIGALPPYELNAPPDGMAIGEVVESNVEGFEPGDMVVHSLGWRDYGRPSPSNPAHRLAKIPADEPLPVQSYLGILSLIGFTAWVGLYKVADLQPGETVWVSAAAGAVGSVVAQIAKLNGHPVIASVGSADKVAYLRDEIGVDAVFDYHDGDVGELVAAAAPNGVDVYFENVGGDHLQAALDVLNPGGRVALCGLISSYNATDPIPGPSNLFEMISKGLTIKGFLAALYAEHLEEYRDLVRGWIADGRLEHRETVVDGLENAPSALADLMSGRSVGKMMVHIG